MGTLKNQIAQDLTTAMKAQDELRTSTLRLLKTAVVNKEIETRKGDLDDAGVLAVIGSLTKQRREAAEQYRAAGRQDLADREAAESAVLQQYLPQQVSPEQLSAEVGRIISETEARGPKDLGAVMKVASAALRGRADGKAVSDEVRAQLGRL